MGNSRRCHQISFTHIQVWPAAALRPAAQTYTTCYKHATVRKSRKVVKKRFNKKIQEDRPDSTAITQAYWLALFYTQLYPCVRLFLYPSSLFPSASPFPCTFLYQFGHSNQITSLDSQAGILMDCKIHAGPLWRDSCSLMMAYQFVQLTGFIVTRCLSDLCLCMLYCLPLFRIMTVLHDPQSDDLTDTVLTLPTLLSVDVSDQLCLWYCLHYHGFASVGFASPLSILMRFLIR